MRKLTAGRRHIIAALVIFIALSIAAAVILGDETDYSELENFEFILEFGPYGDSIINTFENTLTNANYNAENYTDFKMPRRMKKRTYKLMYQLDIMECGKYLSYGVYDYTHPLSYTFQASVGGEPKTIYWSVPWELSGEDIGKLSDEQRRFLLFTNYIISYIRGTKAYRNLPKPTRFYL